MYMLFTRQEVFIGKKTVREVLRTRPVHGSTRLPNNAIVRAGADARCTVSVIFKPSLDPDFVLHELSQSAAAHFLYSPRNTLFL